MQVSATKGKGLEEVKELHCHREEIIEREEEMLQSGSQLTTLKSLMAFY